MMGDKLPIIIVHSGAGYFPDKLNAEKLRISKKAAIVGYTALLQGDDPVDAVEQAVKVMEDDPSCNAGFYIFEQTQKNTSPLRAKLHEKVVIIHASFITGCGSVLTAEGDVEMDAMIIRGADLSSGGVGGIKHVKNAISVARAVMENTAHCLLVGEGAERWAASKGFPLIHSSDLITPKAKIMLDAVLAKKAAPSTETGGADHLKEETCQKEDKEIGLGTVGAVAINSRGLLAAATSTGGLSGKLSGRVGDTPIPGCGTFCDDESCGISATGHGESLMKFCLCSKIAYNIEKGVEPNSACLEALKGMSSRIGKGDGGAILITKDGRVGHAHNSRKMTWAWIKGDELHCGLVEGEETVEKWAPPAP